MRHDMRKVLRIIVIPTYVFDRHRDRRNDETSWDHLPSLDLTVDSARQGTLRGAVSLSLRSIGLRLSLSALDVAPVSVWEGAVTPCM